jgi:hypothetical protein
MKKFVIGISVLSLLLIAGLLVANATEKIYTPVISLLEKATDTALTGNFETARQYAEEAKNLWEKRKNATATVADHTPMEEIDHLFAETDIYARTEEIPHFAACCAQLAVMIRNMGDAHALNLWNLL